MQVSFKSLSSLKKVDTTPKDNLNSTEILPRLYLVFLFKPPLRDLCAFAVVHEIRAIRSLTLVTHTSSYTSSILLVNFFISSAGKIPMPHLLHLKYIISKSTCFHCQTIRDTGIDHSRLTSGRRRNLPGSLSAAYD